MSYIIRMKSGQTYSRDTRHTVTIEWTDERPRRLQSSGPVHNNVHTSSGVYASLREAFDLLAARYGRIVMYAYRASPWSEATVHVAARLPDCEMGASAQWLARRTAAGTSYSDAIDDEWLA